MIRRKSSDTGFPDRIPIPQSYYLDIGNICNLRCPFCSTGNGVAPASEKSLMTREAFDVVFEKLAPHARFVCLFNWGEPFVHKDLLYFVSRFSERGIPVHLDSNLSVRDLTDADAEDVVRSGLHSLFASIDGVTQEAYEAYRVGGKVDRALGNLRQLVQARERLGRDTPGLVWAYYLNRHNEHEVERAKEVAADIGVEIWFKLLSCPEEFQTTRTGDARLLAPPRSLASMHPTAIHPELPTFELHPSIPTVCRQPFNIGVVGPDGLVTPCCAQAGKAFAVGNLLEQEPEEIWNGAPLASCRRFLDGYGPKQGGGSVCEDVCPAVPAHLP